MDAQISAQVFMVVTLTVAVVQSLILGSMACARRQQSRRDEMEEITVLRNF